jgi:hypothetical protein
VSLSNICIVGSNGYEFLLTDCYKVFALKGLRITAQGNALGWLIHYDCPYPYRAAVCKGDSITQGGGEYALPWAIMYRPYRPGFRLYPFNKFQQYKYFASLPK